MLSARAAARQLVRKLRFLFPVCNQKSPKALLCELMLMPLIVAAARWPPYLRNRARCTTFEERRDDAVGEGPLHQLPEDE
jgi:hypothetical protein